MSNRQSNIIFYSIIFLSIFFMLINKFYPNVFNAITHKKEEIIIKEALINKDYERALENYQILLKNSDAKSLDRALIYEGIANIYQEIGAKKKVYEYYEKSLNIKKDLPKVDRLSFAKTLDDLGNIAQELKEYDNAQKYYERALARKLGNIDEIKEKNNSFFLGMQQTRQVLLRLNHKDTIASYISLGNIHKIKKEHKKADEYYEKALKSAKITFGKEDKRTLEIMGKKNLVMKL